MGRPDDKTALHPTFDEEVTSTSIISHGGSCTPLPFYKDNTAWHVPIRSASSQHTTSSPVQSMRRTAPGSSRLHRNLLARHRRRLTHDQLLDAPLPVVYAQSGCAIGLFGGVCRVGELAEAASGGRGSLLADILLWGKTEDSLVHLGPAMRDERCATLEILCALDAVLFAPPLISPSLSCSHQKDAHAAQAPADSHQSPDAPAPPSARDRSPGSGRGRVRARGCASRGARHGAGGGLCGTTGEQRSRGDEGVHTSVYVVCPW